MAWERQRKARYGAEHQARRLRVLRRANYRCQIRGPRCIGRATILDHVVATAFGGPDTDDNSQAACEPCHKEKTAEEAREGIRRRRLNKRPVDTRHPGDDPAR